MKRARRQPTCAEWKAITSARPVVRRIPKPRPTRRGITKDKRRQVDDMDRRGEG
jgi:hypothetical protein